MENDDDREGSVSGPGEALAPVSDRRRRVIVAFEPPPVSNGSAARVPEPPGPADPASPSPPADRAPAVTPPADRPPAPRAHRRPSVGFIPSPTPPVPPPAPVWPEPPHEFDARGHGASPSPVARSEESPADLRPPAAETGAVLVAPAPPSPPPPPSSFGIAPPSVAERSDPTLLAPDTWPPPTGEPLIGPPAEPTTALLRPLDAPSSDGADAGAMLPAAAPAKSRGAQGLLARARDVLQPSGARRARPPHADAGLVGMEAREVTAWFGTHQVLDRISLSMSAGAVTALIGPSGCGKSTFLRILNRMHELVPSARLAGEVLLDDVDIYDPSRRITEARRQIGMVFQKPNPFPAMSIYDNVLAGLKLTGTHANLAERDQLVEECLTKGGLWKEVRDRLRQPGGALSGGQQQRLCIARALANRPRVLLMDEPCSALDPTSTRRIEETITELVSEVTIVIVTHNMQQAARVSNTCAFFLAEQGTPGVIVEHGPTDIMFSAPQDPRTADYVAGRFG